jgi:predicted chitinase
MDYAPIFVGDYVGLKVESNLSHTIFTVTYEQLAKVMKAAIKTPTAANPPHWTLSDMVTPLNMAMEEFSINKNVKRVAGFLAQLALESTELSHWSEDTPKGVKDPIAYFDKKYSHNWRGVGNRGGHDGSDFRGRGPIQLTGRENYSKFGEWLNARQPEKLRKQFSSTVKNRPHPSDRGPHGKLKPKPAELPQAELDKMDENNLLLTHPELVATDIYIGFLASAWFWSVAGNTNGICDHLTLNVSESAERTRFDSLSKIVNGPKCTTYSQRWGYYKKVVAALSPKSGKQQ